MLLRRVILQAVLFAPTLAFKSARAGQATAKVKVATIGSTGFVGAPILREALLRGHTVTAIVRNPAALPPDALSPNLIVKKGDVYNTAELAGLLTGNDALISSFLADGDETNLVERNLVGIKSILAAMKQAGVKRLLVVGTAGYLEVAPGQRFIDSHPLRPSTKAVMNATAEWLNILRDENELDWTFFAPAILMNYGKRTGKFRLGVGNQPVNDAKGENRISLEDYAVAMVDELENPRHTRQRFTIGY